MGLVIVISLLKVLVQKTDVHLSCCPYNAIHKCKHSDPSALTVTATSSQLDSNNTGSDLNSLVVFPDIWMMHLLSFPISLELKGRTLTATFTEAPAMLLVGVWARRRGDDTQLEPARVDDETG